jgi:hypothetical protein
VDALIQAGPRPVLSSSSSERSLRAPLIEKAGTAATVVTRVP